MNHALYIDVELPLGIPIQILITNNISQYF